MRVLLYSEIECRAACAKALFVNLRMTLHDADSWSEMQELKVKEFACPM